MIYIGNIILWQSPIMWQEIDECKYKYFFDKKYSGTGGRINGEFDPIYRDFDEPKSIFHYYFFWYVVYYWYGLWHHCTIWSEIDMYLFRLKQKYLW